MVEAVSNEIASLLDSAECERICLRVSDDRLRKALIVRAQADQVVHPFPKLFARTEWWTQLDRNERDLCVLRTLCAHDPNLVLCSYSAALVHGLSVHHGLRSVIHAASSYQARRNHMIRHAIPHDDAQLIDGIRVTPLARTLYDSLKDLDFQRGLAIADSALARTGQNANELSEMLRTEFSRCRGIRRCLSTVAHADGRAESGGESVARAIIIEQGFELPDLQVEFPSLIIGGEPYRSDMYWDLAFGQAVIGELDGIDKYCDLNMTRGRDAVAVMSEERIRESRISRFGRLMRFRYRHLENVPDFVALLESFGIPRRTGA